MFSDNFILCLPINENKSLERIVNFASRMKSMVMFHLGILVKGANTKGSIYLDEDIVFGQGLVDAYLLETKECIYPKIIIDKKLNNNEYILKSEHRLVKFKNEYMFVNYLYFNFSDSVNNSPNCKKKSR